MFHDDTVKFDLVPIKISNIWRLENFLKNYFSDVKISGYLTEDGIRQAHRNYDGKSLLSVLILQVACLLNSLKIDGYEVDYYFDKNHTYFSFSIKINDHEKLMDFIFEKSMIGKFPVFR